jgi:hypothetical protein
VLANRSDPERNELRAQFDEAMTLNMALFGEHAFRKSLANGLSATRSVINISLFEVCAVAMAGLGPLNAEQKEDLRKAIIALLSEAAFTNAITYSTNSTTQVRTRFDTMDAAVTELLRAEK